MNSLKAGWCNCAHGVLLVGLLCGGCSQPEAAKSDSARPVKTVVVATGENLRTRSFPGTVEASRRVELAFRVPGLLAKLPVKEGQKVAEGDLIAQLRQDEFQARLKSLQSDLEQSRAALQSLRAGERPEEIQRREAELRAATATLANARSQYERHRTLIERNAVSKSAFEQSETAYQVAEEQQTAALKSLQQATVGREEDIEAMEAQVRGLEARVVEAQIQLDDSTLKAPYDGVIAQRFVDEGQNIMSNDRVVQFQDVDEIDIAVDVPEAVMAGEILYADIEAKSAELSAAPGVEFPVRIREVAQVADPVTQTFKVRVAMEAPPGIRVLPGMTASVTISYRRASVLGERMMVPVEAVAETSDGQQVAWVMSDEGTANSRPIKVGAPQGGQLEVIDGLEPGDRVIIAGVRFLHNGMKVRDLGDALGGGQP